MLRLFVPRHERRSERAYPSTFGNALDIAEFTLADGHKVVRCGWHGTPEQGCCRRAAGRRANFTTVLAPGANVYHYNHVHVDLMRHYRRHICEPSAVRWSPRRSGTLRRATRQTTVTGSIEASHATSARSVIRRKIDRRPEAVPGTIGTPALQHRPDRDAGGGFPRPIDVGGFVTLIRSIGSFLSMIGSALGSFLAHAVALHHAADDPALLQERHFDQHFADPALPARRCPPASGLRWPRGTPPVRLRFQRVTHAAAADLADLGDNVRRRRRD